MKPGIRTPSVPAHNHSCAPTTSVRSAPPVPRPPRCTGIAQRCSAAVLAARALQRRSDTARQTEKRNTAGVANKRTRPSQSHWAARARLCTAPELCRSARWDCKRTVARRRFRSEGRGHVDTTQDELALSRQGFGPRPHTHRGNLRLTPEDGIAFARITSVSSSQSISIKQMRIIRRVQAQHHRSHAC